jgi:hypothetical protein
MPDFSNTFTTAPGSAASNREDLTDILSILAPEETPILSGGSRKKASNVNFEWTLDKLDNPAALGVVEGDDVATFTDAFAARERTSNYVQKFRRDYMVSDLQEATDSVGPAKLAEAEAKSIRELKRDIELRICSAEDKQVGSGSDPYLTAGLGAFIDDTPATGLVPAGFETPSDSIYADTGFNEVKFNDLISSIYRQTGNVDSLTLVADTGLRRHISDFARINGALGDTVRSVNYDGGSSTIKLSVELYQSDHGIVSIINANPACMPASTKSADGTDNNTGYLVNPEYYGIHELIPMGSTRLPNQGGGERGYVDCVLGLGVYHPQAHGKITQID